MKLVTAADRFGSLLTQDLTNCHPLLPSHRFAIFVIQIYAVHKLAIDVKLLVEGCTITNTNRGAVPISREVTVVHQNGNLRTDYEDLP